jgi:hypothetical protein
MLVTLFLIIITALIFTNCQLGEPVQPPSYTIVYNSNGGIGSMENSTHVYGTAKNLNPSTFTRTNHAFAGWAESPSGTVKYADMQSVINLTQENGATITLYAQWLGNPYTVISNANGGNGIMEISVIPIDESQKLRINTFTRTNHAFAGWAKSPTGTAEFINEQSVTNLTSIGATITLYAIWDQIYTVVYNANGGNGDITSSILTYDQSYNLRINTFTNPGFTFAGWATCPTGTVEYTDGQSVNNLSNIPGTTISLYAVWVGNNFMVAYNANGGNGNMEVSNFIYGEFQNLRLNTFINNNPSFAFAGWATSATGPVLYTDGQSLNNLTTMAGATVTLYAVWIPVTIVPGSSLAAKLLWLQSNALSNVNYTVEVTSNENINPTTFLYSGRNNIGITLKSIGAERIIALSSNGSLFIVGNGVTLTLENNITLQGRNTNNASLVRVESGSTLIINNGAKISGNNAGVSAAGGGIFVGSNGTVVMNGGTISENNGGDFGGGIEVDYATFTMRGGRISGNTAAYGGGINIYPNATVIMYGGIINGNNANFGGGICVNPSGIFRKIPLSGGQPSGIIYGSEATGVDIDGIFFRNTASNNNNGHAVYHSPTRRRNATAGQTDHIDTSSGRGLSSSGNPPFGN